MVRRRKTTAEFIEQAQKKHNNKYDYSKSIYKINSDKLIIICSKHGEFKQSPSLHLNGHGCSQCRYDKAIKSQETFIKEIKEKHNNKYDYSLVRYKSARHKIKIICPNHGTFLQLAAAHLRGQGCPKCAGNIKKTTKEFINQASQIHNNKYDYSCSNYKTARNNITINCPKHGKFTQNVQDHLKGYGCNRCSSIISIPETKWLNNLKVPDRQISIKINNKTFIVDGFDPKTNTIYEFYGDYWHGNPQNYKPNEFNKSTNCSFGELFEKTKEKEKIIKKAGFNLVTIWENDFNE